MTEPRETAAAPSPIPPQITVTPLSGDALAASVRVLKRSEDQQRLADLLDFSLRYAKSRKHAQPLYKEPLNLNADLHSALAMMLSERMDHAHLQMLAGLDAVTIEMVVKESLKFGAV